MTKLPGESRKKKEAAPTCEGPGSPPSYPRNKRKAEQKLKINNSLGIFRAVELFCRIL